MISDTLSDAVAEIESYLADHGSYAEIDQQIRQLLAHMDAVRQWLDTPDPVTDLASPDLASHVAQQLRIFDAKKSHPRIWVNPDANLDTSELLEMFPSAERMPDE